MAGNDKNCIPNSQLEAYSDGVQARKIRPKNFLAVLIKNDKNYTQTMWVQNRIIQARFSTLPAQSVLQWCPGPKKSSNFDRKSFKSY